MIALAKPEARRLATLEIIIEAGMPEFQRVGLALAEIRDKRLYRDNYGTFAAYVAGRWGKKRLWAYRQITAAAVAEMYPIGIQNERQARALAVPDPLADLTAEEQLATIKAAEIEADKIPDGRPKVRDHRAKILRILCDVRLRLVVCEKEQAGLDVAAATVADAALGRVMTELDKYEAVIRGAS